MKIKELVKLLRGSAIKDNWRLEERVNLAADELERLSAENKCLWRFAYVANKLCDDGEPIAAALNKLLIDTGGRAP